MTPIPALLAQICLGKPQSHRNLTLYPLIAKDHPALDYLTLDQALQAKTVKITEVSEGGSVPELYFLNQGDRAVLLLDGEELVGAKQNRIVNLSILASGHSTIKIPVSCVEQGRWHYREREFTASDRSYFAKGRAKKMDRVSTSLRQRGQRDGHQGEVWAEVNEMSDAMDVLSDTRAMADIYEQSENQLQPYLATFGIILNQVGAIFAINNQIMGLEYFDCPPTFSHLFPKLLRSYALDALSQTQTALHPANPVSVMDFLAKLANMTVETFPALGEGSDLRLTSPTTVGSILFARERVIHLSAFRRVSEEKQ